jgi:hypothetical protein
MATTRLRKTFKYPSEDEDSDASRDELDEEGNECSPPHTERIHSDLSIQNKNHLSLTSEQKRRGRMPNTI